MCTSSGALASARARTCTPTTAPCEACVTTWLDHRDPCSEVRERLPDHDPRTHMTARSWHDRAWPRYELGLAHGYVDCEITPISSATDSDVLRAGAFVLDEAQLRVAGPHVTHHRDQTSLRWLVPGYATDSPHHTTGRLALRVQKGWRTRWLRIEVQERTGPVRE
jgi:hypothetical protein